MKLILKPILAIFLAFFAFNSMAEEGQAVDLATTVIEQPAAAVVEPAPTPAPTPVATQPAAASKPGAGAVQAALSVILENQESDMKKCAEMVNNLSSQIKELQDRSIEMNMTIQSMEAMAKTNVKIVISCLIALLVLSLALLFKRCSCRTKTDEMAGK